MRSKESLKFDMELIYAVMRTLSRETLWFDLQEVEKTFPNHSHSLIHAVMFFLTRDGFLTRKYDMAHHEMIYKINSWQIAKRCYNKSVKRGRKTPQTR